jgi:hypothetical protein
MSPPRTNPPRIPQQNISPSPNLVQLPIQRVEPIQPTVSDADIDPFEHEPLGFDSRAEQVSGYDVSPEHHRASVDEESLDGEDETGEESQLFPGSGLF